MSLEAHRYLLKVIKQHTLTAEKTSKMLFKVKKALYPIIQEWGGNHLRHIGQAGSLAKGTHITGTSDIDLFVSLHYKTPYTLREIFCNLHDYLEAHEYKTRKQNVSVNIIFEGISVDIVPGTRQPLSLTDHSIYRRKADSWTKTNINKHIQLVKNSKRISDIKLMKIWRKFHGLDFPSFYLELCVIDALHGCRYGNLPANFTTVLTYLAEDFQSAKHTDPANSNNTISDDLTDSEKAKIAKYAKASLDKQYWEEVIQ